MDQTILDLMPIHERAFERAFKQIFKRKTCLRKISFTGKTYTAITREIGMLEGVKRQEIEQNTPQVIKLIQNYFIEHTKKEKIKPLKGAEELLKKLSKNKENILAIASASPRKIVELSLKNSGLAKYFSDAVTASDGETKTELAQILKKRIECRSKMKIETFVIGDATEDISAGAKIKATTIGVATGLHSEKELIRSGAEFTFKELSLKIAKIINEH